MPWFKVDDGLHAHKKAARAGADAMGLWVLAGSWCADQLTDGFVPDYIAVRLDPKAKAKAAKLCAAGFWFPAERDGDKGWQFHDWHIHQPAAKETIAKREAAKDRMQALRDRRRAERGKNSANGSESVRANAPGTFGGGSSEVRSAPTRPDPTRPELPTEVQNQEPLQAVDPLTNKDHSEASSQPRNDNAVPEQAPAGPYRFREPKIKLPRERGQR
jgi:hypothetical protein